MFEGKYYDGRTSQGMPAFINLEPNHIHIRYQAGEEQGAVTWFLQDIRRVEYNNGTTLLQYSGIPKQSIAVFEQGFPEALEQKYTGAKFLSLKNNPSSKGTIRGLLLIGLGLLVLLVGFFVWGVPMLAGKAAAHFPEEYERALGEQLHARMLDNHTVDPAKTAALRKYLEKLKIESDFPLTVTVIEDTTVNAFAVPGGFVVVHSGILDKMQHHEELAGLLGHEIGHVQMRHSTKALARSLSYYMLFSVLLGDISGIVAVIVDNASNLYNLEYSRSAESDADRAGLQLLRQNNLDPEGMVWLMERLASGEPEFANFTSTHPRTSDRIRKLESEIRNQKYKTIPNPALEAAWKELKQ